MFGACVFHQIHSQIIDQCTYTWSGIRGVRYFVKKIESSCEKIYANAYQQKGALTKVAHCGKKKDQPDDTNLNKKRKWDDGTIKNVSQTFMIGSQHTSIKKSIQTQSMIEKLIQVLVSTPIISRCPRVSVMAIPFWYYQRQKWFQAQHIKRPSWLDRRYNFIFKLRFFHWLCVCMRTCGKGAVVAKTNRRKIERHVP